MGRVTRWMERQGGEGEGRWRGTRKGRAGEGRGTGGNVQHRSRQRDRKFHCKEKSAGEWMPRRKRARRDARRAERVENREEGARDDEVASPLRRDRNGGTNAANLEGCSS